MDLTRINYFWPRIGAILAPIIVTIVVLQWNTGLSLLSLIYWVHLAILMLHEVEEYVFPGGFKEFFNYHTVFSLPEPQDNVPINDIIILVINLGFWIIFAIAAIIANIAPWLGIAMVIMNFSNIFGHLLLFQMRQKGYNPGLITAALLLIPFTYYVFDFVNKHHLMNGLDWVLAIIFGLLAAVSLPITGTITRRRFLLSRAM